MSARPMEVLGYEKHSDGSATMTVKVRSSPGFLDPNLIPMTEFQIGARAVVKTDGSVEFTAFDVVTSYPAGDVYDVGCVSGDVVLDCSLAHSFRMEAVGPINLNFANLEKLSRPKICLDLRGFGKYVVTWPEKTKFAIGFAPCLSQLQSVVEITVVDDVLVVERIHHYY